MYTLQTQPDTLPTTRTSLLEYRPLRTYRNNLIFIRAESATMLWKRFFLAMSSAVIFLISVVSVLKVHETEIYQNLIQDKDRSNVIILAHHLVHDVKSKVKQKIKL